MMPDISNEAVEAAQQAVIEAMIEHGPDGHIDGYEEITRAALEAAAPHLMAQAWDEGYGAMVHDAFRDQELVKRGSRLDSDKATPNPYRPAGADRG